MLMNSALSDGIQIGASVRGTIDVKRALKGKIARVARPLCVLLLVAGMASAAFAAEKSYGPGVTDTEIKIGNIAPYSGPASAYSLIAKTEAAYFKMINESGGINGRKINFISYDDAYSPPKAVEQARKLIDSDEVLALFGTIGTASNSAIQAYMNRQKVPQLFVGSGAQDSLTRSAFRGRSVGSQTITRKPTSTVSIFAPRSIPPRSLSSIRTTTSDGIFLLESNRDLATARRRSWWPRRRSRSPLQQLRQLSSISKRPVPIHWLSPRSPSLRRRP